MTDDRITYIGRVDHRSGGPVFGIRQRDRRSHFYIVGKTGTGKSHLLRLMLEQDIAAGQGCALFDPHGDLAAQILATVPADKRQDVLNFDVPNPGLRWRFNPLKGIESNDQALAAAGMVEVFKKIWPDEWGPRLEHLTRNVVFTLLETQGSSLADVPALLSDKTYRSQVVAGLTNVAVRQFWKDEYDRYSQPFRAVVAAPLQNKLGALLTDPLLRRILTEEGPQLDLKSAMDDGKILIVNLDKGRIGESPAVLLGSFILSHIAIAGLSRSSQEEANRRDFLVYLDEFQTFTTLSIATMLAELRKYRVGLVLAHQYLDQLDEDIRSAVFGNVGSLVAFRVGAQDAPFIAREFHPRFDSTDLTSLPRFAAYVRLMIDGATSPPFSAKTLEAAPEPRV